MILLSYVYDVVVMISTRQLNALPVVYEYDRDLVVQKEKVSRVCFCRV